MQWTNRRKSRPFLSMQSVFCEGEKAGMLRLILLCHAATDATRQARFPGDEPIEERERQRLAIWNPSLPARMGQLFLSPELRVQQTAEVLRLPERAEQMEITAALADLEYGTWRGRTLADCAQTMKEAVQSWIKDPDAAPHGGESVSALLRRVSDWLNGVAEHSGGYVMAVTHPAVMRAAVIHALGAPVDAFWRIDIAPLSCVEMNAGGGRWQLRGIIPAHHEPE
ncbi:Phosphoglycerate mutase/fructose-2,6-bisphosphatase [Granulibacter bethesdensis]|uniref:Phosphoglycerate mutase/fructose-2,6-bisphosphatase n=2 Tax=Granulibacter bethesdensis TaxID=364410 RepID=A0AAN0RG73_9PROT|nr:Phosphoglycerate mutase/fructose-2,6-bisphosphatase [Granulibacter bethesdensis]